MESLTRSFEAQIDDVKVGERSVVAKINTGDVDRYRTVIMPTGADLNAYRKNPIVLWEHGKDPARGTMPVGRNEWIKTSSDGLVAKTIFKDDAYSNELFRCYQDGWLRGWSVMMVNPKYGPPSREEVRSRPELSDCETVYRSWELGEYSGTALPGNKDTLTILASRGIWLSDEARGIVATSATATPVGEAMSAMDDDEDETKRYITHSDGKWIVHAESGKTLGTHDSEEGAKKQLAAVEAHKHDKGRSGPFVDTDGSHWWVNDGHGQKMLTVRDASVAQEALTFMQVPRSSRNDVAILMGEMRALEAERQKELKEYIDLYTRGRI